MSQNPFPPLSAAPAADETSQVAKENVVSDQVHIKMIAHLQVHYALCSDEGHI